MSKTSLRNCSGCESSDNKVTDCSVCKLADLREHARKAKESRSSDGKQKVTIDDDDYSISEKLTEKRADHSILILFIAALFTFALVILFTMLLR